MTRQPPRRSASTTTRLLAAAGLVALLGGMAFIVMGETGDDGAQDRCPRDDNAGPTTPPPVKKPPAPTRIVVTGVGAYDPEGDKSENGGDARLATDGNAKTAWKTEHYRSTFGKSGVGLVLDAGRPVKASRVVVTTETPGYAAQVQVGNSADGPVQPRVGIEDDGVTHGLRAEAPTRALRGDLDHVDARGRRAAAVNEVRVTAGG